MLVTLKDTGEEIEKSLAFKSGQYYFSSEIAKKKYESNKFWRPKCIDLISEILGEEPKLLSTYLYKRIKDFENVGYIVLYHTVRDQENSIRHALDIKDFDTDFGKISYVFAIITNNYKETIKRLKTEKAKNNTPKIVDEREIKTVKNPTQKVKDIKHYIDEEN